ncbi:unnamed protein product [marine sediment metagenome]|uniref:HTH luxR-type domain-containing protein n=1 Tax=marine sediment metagenome TaxID=412755 RepID=X1SJW6_9ZZZZ
MEWPFAPFEALRRDLERIKAAVDSTPNPLATMEEVERAVARYGSALRGAAQRRVEKNLLTSTEHEVLRLAAEGLSNREIAERLGIAIGTVRVHLKDIRRAIGVATTEEAVAAFGEPTERERVPISILRLPRPPSVTAAPYERRAAGLLPLVDELERSPSMEAVGRLEDDLHDLAEEVIGARALTYGIEATRFSDLHSRLASTIEEVVLARAAIESMERETLPMRIEAARRGFLLRTQAMRENLMRGG